MPIYFGVGGKAKQISSGFYGVNGKASVIYDSSVVPSGYIPYKYLYATNNAASIEINKTFNSFCQIICNFKVIKKNSSGTSYLFKSSNIQVNANAGSLSFNTIKRDKSYNTTLTSGSEYSLNLTKDLSGNCYLGNTLIFTTISTFSDNYIDILQDAYSVFYLSRFYAKNLATGTELCDLTPCIQVSSNTAGMWDTVSNSFKTESNSNYRQYLQCSN